MTQAFRMLTANAQGREDHLAFMEPLAQRVRVVLGGETVADSKRVLIMHETNHSPVYYFPFDDVRMDLMHPTDHSTT